MTFGVAGIPPAGFVPQNSRAKIKSPGSCYQDFVCRNYGRAALDRRAQK